MSNMHYREFFESKYIGAWSLKGDTIVTITAVRKESVYNPQTNDSPAAMVVDLAEFDLPMVVSITNARSIGKALSSDETENWIGKKVTIYAGQSKRSPDGVAIRVRPEPPKMTKDKLSDERFAKMLAQIQAGKYSAEKAKETFSLTPEQLKQLSQ